MDVLDSILEKLQSIESMAHDIMHMDVVGGSQIIVMGLDELSDNLGLIKAGEFRSGTGTPGTTTGYTGVRIGAPGWTYSGTQYSIVGLNADVLQFGLCNTDGKLYAGGGDVVIDQYGIFMYGNASADTTNNVYFKYESGGVVSELGKLCSFYAGTGTGFVMLSSNVLAGDPWTQTVISLKAEDGINDKYSDLAITANGGCYLQAYDYGADPDIFGRIDCKVTGSVEFQSYPNSNTNYFGVKFLGGNRTVSEGAYIYSSILVLPHTFIGPSPSTVTKVASLYVNGRPGLTTITSSRRYAEIISGTDGSGGGGALWLEDGGLDLHDGTGAGDGDMCYSGDLMPYRNSTAYTGYVSVPLTAPLTSTSWDGDAYSTAAKTVIDLSSVFSAPAGIKAVKVYWAWSDSGSAGADCWLCLSPNSTAGSGIYLGAYAQANGKRVFGYAEIPCDANGDIYYQTNASGASTMNIWLQIWGYCL